MRHRSNSRKSVALRLTRAGIQSEVKIFLNPDVVRKHVGDAGITLRENGLASVILLFGSNRQISASRSKATSTLPRTFGQDCTKLNSAATRQSLGWYLDGRQKRYWPEGWARP